MSQRKAGDQLQTIAHLAEFVITSDDLFLIWAYIRLTDSQDEMTTHDFEQRLDSDAS